MREESEGVERELSEITTERLIAALQTLPKFQRSVYLAAAADGLTYAEIGRQTGITVRQVERVIANALVKIDRKMCADAERGRGR